MHWGVESLLVSMTQGAIACLLIDCDAYTSSSKHKGRAASPIISAVQHITVFLAFARLVASFGHEVPVDVPGSS